jgi:mRNA interferase RelE/StbE
VTATAARALSERLPESVAVAVLEFLHGDLLRAPRRVGHELQRELVGTWSARRGSYRILYEGHDDVPDAPDAGSADSGTVRVVDVDHGGDVYRRR